MQNSSQKGRTVSLGFLPQQQPSAETTSTLVGMGSGGTQQQPNGSCHEFRVHDHHQQGRENQQKKSMPMNGKKTKGRVKIKMEFIDNKLRRYTTFSKRKTGIMKKAYELSTLTGTQVMLLVASETGHVYTFATRKLQPMITSEAGKALIQTCLNSPDPPLGPGGSSGLDQRMSATGFEETDLTYSVGDDNEKLPDDMDERGMVYSSPSSPQSGGSSPRQFSSSPSLTSAAQMVTLSSTSPSFLQQQLTTTNAGFATILAATPGGTLPPSVQIGTFHNTSSTSSTSESTSSKQPSTPTSIYRIPAQGASPAFSVSLSGSKNQSSSQSTAQGTVSVVQNSQQQNLSLVPGNVMIPAAQTILQGGSSGNSLPGAFMYHTAQGLVYATPTSLPEGMILNLGQEQGGAPQQFITIPVSLSLTPAQQQQLMQVSPATATSSCQVTSCTPTTKSHRSRK